jgi:diguanylate cyclase (GGDEF)-like protein
MGWCLTAAVIAGILVLLSAFTADWIATSQSNESRRLAERSTLAAIGSDQVRDLLVDAQNSQRAYLLTGDGTYLRAYRHASGRLPSAMDALLRLTKPGSENRARVLELRGLAQARTAEMTRSIELRRTQGLPAALDSPQGAGTAMPRIRALDAELQRATEAQTADQEAAARRTTASAENVNSVMTVVLLALLVVMLFLVRQRGKAEQERTEDERERLRLIDQLGRRANHDALTGLPNKRLLLDRIQQALARSARDDTLTAVLYIDLDRLEAINETRGHETGDAVLVEAARQLQAQVRATDTLARVGDEFVALCEGLISAAQADQLAQSLEDQLSGGVVIGGERVPVTASVGYVLAEHNRIYGEPETRTLSPEQLIDAADAAMHQAKEGGRGRRHLYHRSDARRRTDRSSLAADLRKALADHQLWVAYQPLVELAGGRPVGVEALLRWDHPVRGAVPPATFIPVAEETGLIIPVGTFVLEQACAQVGAWNAERGSRGLGPLGVSVNCSARQLLDRRFLEVLTGAMREGGITPDHLTLEITEGVLIDSVTGAADRLDEIAATGVGLSLDDFGTGYSSLSYLSRFPVRLIKIDQSFVSGLGRSDTDEAIIAAVVSLADRLGRRVLAEGIETAEQASQVAQLGCQLGQGYFFGRPQAAHSLDALLTSRQTESTP